MRILLMVLALAVLALGCGIAPEVVEARREAEAVAERIQTRAEAIAATWEAYRKGEIAEAEAMARLGPWLRESQKDAARAAELKGVLDEHGTSWWYLAGGAAVMVAGGLVTGGLGAKYAWLVPLARTFRAVMDGVDAANDPKVRAAIQERSITAGVGGLLDRLVHERRAERVAEGEKPAPAGPKEA